MELSQHSNYDSLPAMDDDDDDITIDGDGDFNEPVAETLRQQASLTQCESTSSGFSERGRRFLIDCLLNLPKEETSTSDGKNSLNSSASNSFTCSGTDKHSGTPNSTESSSKGALANGTNSSWNGLSKPSEIRKVYSANTTWPLWIYYTRYTHRPQALQAASSSSGHNRLSAHRVSSTHSQPSSTVSGSSTSLRLRGSSSEMTSRRSASSSKPSRRVRLAFTADQLKRLKEEFECNHYLNEPRRKAIALELDLKEAQVKVWFQNKRAQLRRICNASSFFFLQPSANQQQQV